MINFLVTKALKAVKTMPVILYGGHFFYKERFVKSNEQLRVT
jgi:hypothetical protein